MPNSAGGAGKKRKRTPTWHDLAAETDAKRMQWTLGKNHTEFVPCGFSWDAVAIGPIGLGLDALVAMRIGTRRGYRIVADHLRDQLHVIVPPGSGEHFDNIPGVRVLARGHQLLMPRTVGDRSQVADWVGIPRDDLVVVDPARLADRLHELALSFYEPVTK